MKFINLKISCKYKCRFKLGLMTYTIPLEFPWSMTYFLQQASGLLAHITVGELKIPVYICFDFLCFLFVSTRLVIYKNISFSQSLNHKGGEEVCGCGREGKMWGFCQYCFMRRGLLFK